MNSPRIIIVDGKEYEHIGPLIPINSPSDLAKNLEASVSVRVHRKNRWPTFRKLGNGPTKARVIFALLMQKTRDDLAEYYKHGI